MNAIENTISQHLGTWVGAVHRRAIWAVLGFLLLTVAFVFYIAGNLGIRGDTDSLFSDDLLFKQVENRYHEAFPMLFENMFVVLDAATPERAGEAASDLAARLTAEPQLFKRVYLPGGGDFFESNAFLYLETEELEDLADRLALAQPYLAGLSQDGTLRGLVSMMARGGRAVREGDVSGDQLQTLFDRFGSALQARIQDRPYQLSWADVVTQSQFDSRRRFLLIQPVFDFEDLQPAKRSILAVRRIAKELGLTPESGVTVRLTGDVVLSFEEMEMLHTQAITTGAVSFILVAVILALGLRSIRQVIGTLVTLVVGLVWTGAFATVAIGHLNLISVSFAVLFIGLGVDFGIHFCIRYRELLADGCERGVALSDAARNVGSSLTLCSMTTAIGFFAFVPTHFIGVAELGLISGAGMFISLFCTLTLLPALLSLGPAPHRRGQSTKIAWSADGLASIPTRYPKTIRMAALIFGVCAIALLPRARFDNNPLLVRDPSSEAVRTFSDLLERGTPSPWTLNAVASDLDAAAVLVERLRALDVVERVVTVADFVPEDQDEKLGIIGDVAMFLAPEPTSDGAVPAPSYASQIEALQDLDHELTRLIASGERTTLHGSATALQPLLRRYLQRLDAAPNPDREVETLQASLLGALPEQLRMLNAALTAGRVTLDNLPVSILERMMTDDGRVRIQIFPRENLSDQAALEDFVDTVMKVTPEVAGSASEILESGRAVVDALTQAMLTALAVITVFLLVLWRRLDDTALVLIPLLLASALTVAAAVLLGIPFNFADVIVLPLLLGIGVDSGIHLVHRARVANDRGAGLLHTSTARAVGYSAITTIASFGTLGFASHMGLATLGRLLTLGVGFTIICNLVVLPTLIQLKPIRPEDAKS